MSTPSAPTRQRAWCGPALAISQRALKMLRVNALLAVSRANTERLLCDLMQRGHLEPLHAYEARLRAEEWR